MKKVSIVSLIALIAIVISSCGTSNNVVNNHGISKRKYNKGFFFNRKSNLKTADAQVKEADFKEDKSIAKAERVEARKAKKEQRKIEFEPHVAESNVAESNYRFSPSSTPAEDVELNQKPTGFLSDDVNDIEWSVTENPNSTTGETMEQARTSPKTSKNSSQRGAAGGVHIILLVILALIIPPLAVFLFEGATSRFWIDLVLAIIGVGLGFGIGGLAYLASLAAVIYALLIVLNVI